ncbi:MAG: AAA family ATPase [Pseudomonadota bacterium]
MLKLTRVRVEGLFGCLDHEIPLNEEGITFIHGPNGCGKTTVLKLLDGALSCQLSRLWEVEFKSIEITFGDLSTVVISKTQEEQTESPSSDILPELTEESVKTVLNFTEFLNGRRIRGQEVLSDTSDPEEIAALIRRKPAIVSKYLPHLIQSGTRAWRDRDSKLILSPGAIAKKYGDAFPFNIPAWYREKVAKVPRGYIETQRLLKLSRSSSDEMFDETTLEQVVGLFAEELKREMAATIERSALDSQSRERSFPQRILAGDFPSSNEQELRALYAQLQERLKNLSDVGLQEATDEIALSSQRLNPTMKRVLGLYLSDLNDKLDVFLDLQKRIQLIKDLFGTKLRRKNFQITRNDGFLLTDTTSGKSINPTLLSSGEQHLLVMLYQLVFSTEENQFFLIDEPEISIHVEWQRMFLEDLLKIAALRGHVFLIATHSPQIINNRMDLAVPLDGGITV